MIVGKIAGAVLKLLLPKVTQKVTDHLAKIFKLDQVLRYMELPNDADKKIEKVEAQLKMLAEDVHPPVDFPLTKEQSDELLDFMKKMKNKKIFKKLG